MGHDLGLRPRTPRVVAYRCRISGCVPDSCLRSQGLRVGDLWHGYVVLEIFPVRWPRRPELCLGLIFLALGFGGW